MPVMFIVSGVTCLYLLTGKSPKDMNYDQTTGELSWQEHITVSDSFQDILANMLEVSVRDRYQSVQEVLNALASQKRSTRSVVTDPSISFAPTRAGEAPTIRAASSIRAHQARARRQPPLTESLSRLSNPSPQSHRGFPTPIPRSGPQSDRRHLRSRPPSELPVSGRQSQPGLNTRSPKNLKMTLKGLQQTYRRGQRDFSGRDLGGVNLRRAQLPEAIFHEAMFQQADLRGANLEGANLGRANFTHANLKNASLNRAYLSYADLGGADLSGASLIDTHLSNANLRGANLCGANLTGALVTEGQLALARTNWMTVMPNGKRGRPGKRLW